MSPALEQYGVYQIRNLTTNALYVGSTCTSFAARWATHKKRLRNGSHENEHLLRAYRKYGPVAFSFEILEIVTDPNQVLLTEQRWLDSYRAANQPLYNINPVTCSPPSAKGKKLSGQTLEARRAINQARARSYPAFIDTRTGERFDAGTNLAEFCRQHDLLIPKMNQVANGKRLSHNGFMRLADWEQGQRPRQPFESVLLKSPDGEIHQVPAGRIAAFCTAHNLPSRGIHRLVRGERNHCHGWQVCS